MLFSLFDVFLSYRLLDVAFMMPPDAFASLMPSLDIFAADIISRFLLIDAPLPCCFRRHFDAVAFVAFAIFAMYIFMMPLSLTIFFDAAFRRHAALFSAALRRRRCQRYFAFSYADDAFRLLMLSFTRCHAAFITLMIFLIFRFISSFAWPLIRLFSPMLLITPLLMLIF